MFEFVKNIRRDDRGVGTVEFSFCFPIVLAVFCLGMTYWSANRVSQSVAYASTIAVDLVTREHNLSDSIFERIFRVTESVAGPGGEADDFTVAVASISNPIYGDSENSDIEVDWFNANRDVEPITNDDLSDLDLPLIPPGDSVILVAVSSSYTLGFVPEDIASLDFYHRSVRRPRFVNRMAFGDDAG